MVQYSRSFKDSCPLARRAKATEAAAAASPTSAASLSPKVEDECDRRPDSAYASTDASSSQNNKRNTNRDGTDIRMRQRKQYSIFRHCV